MDILGIGIQEIIFILVIALIIFGPKDLVKAGQAAGQFLRRLITSPTWRSVQNTSRQLRSLPNKLMREAGLEEIKDDLNQIDGFRNPKAEIEKIKQEIEGEFKSARTGLSAWTTPSSPPEHDTPPPTEEN